MLQALLAGLFTWAMTALGALPVLFTREFSRRVLDWMLGFAGGVMIAASFWSLLLPAIEMAAIDGGAAWLPAAAGFAAGGFFLLVLDRLIPHLHIGFPPALAEGPRTTLGRSTLLAIAMTLHNIPEGLAVGVAFAAAAAGVPQAGIAGAIALAVGIGIQNFPEGLSVAIPLRREGMTSWRSFFTGQLTAAVEPVAAVAGALAIYFFRSFLPYALSFAAGAMIFVVVEEVIPESQLGGNADLATTGILSGFITMMVLDLAF